MTVPAYSEFSGNEGKLTNNVLIPPPSPPPPRGPQLRDGAGGSVNHRPRRGAQRRQLVCVAADRVADRYVVYVHAAASLGELTIYASAAMKRAEVQLAHDLDTLRKSGSDSGRENKARQLWAFRLRPGMLQISCTPSAANQVRIANLYLLCTTQVDLDLAAIQQWLGKFVTMKCTTAFKQAHGDLLQIASQQGAAASAPTKDAILREYFKSRQFMVSCLQKY